MVTALKSPNFYKKQFPILPSQSQFVDFSRKLISNIIEGKSKELLILVGPCSIHDVNAAMDFASKLAELQKKLPYLKIVMRTYFEKPRTRHGWRGLLSDPFLNNSYDVAFGLELVRKLLLDINSLKVTCATEFLNPLFTKYFEDLIGLGMIGARTSSSAIHRTMASHLNMLIGFKNTTSGNIEVAINAMIVANEPQHFVNINDEGQIACFLSGGNPNTFLVMRGSETSSNFDPPSIKHATEQIKKAKLHSQILVDCAHGNSLGPLDQAEVFLKVLNQIENGDQSIFGLMLESFLFAGSTSIDNKKYGVSITDECIDFETTKELLEKANEVICQVRLNRTKAGV